jgi:hypothetical protein
MRKPYGAALLPLLLTLCGTVYADDEVKEVKAKPGRLVVIEAEADAPDVLWIKGDPDADTDLLPNGPKKAIFLSPTPGRFHVLAIYAGKDGKAGAARFVVIVEGAKPNPTPGPTPNPTDPFAAELQVLFAADASPGKAAHLALLAEVYKQAPKYANDPTVTGTQQLFQLVSTTSRSLLPETVLVPLRQRVARELATVLGGTDRPMDAPARLAATALFEKIRAALEAVK